MLARPDHTAWARHQGSLQACWPGVPRPDFSESLLSRTNEVPARGKFVSADAKSGRERGALPSGGRGVIVRTAAGSRGGGRGSCQRSRGVGARARASDQAASAAR